MTSDMAFSVRRSRSLAVAILIGAAQIGAAHAEDLKPWRHGIVEAKSDAGFVMMASRHGFAEKHGLKIEMTQLKGDALVLKAFLAGELDSYEGSPGGAIIAASHGADVKVVGCYWTGLTYGLFARGDITSIDQVKGKNFGISSPGSLPDLMVRAVLEQAKIPIADVRFAMMGSDADRFRALSSGIIDVAAASTEFVPLAESQKLHLLLHAHDALPNYLRFCTYVSGKTLATRREEARHFLAAEMEGLQYAMTHKEDELQLTRETINAKPEDPRPAYVFDEVVRYSAIDPTMPLPLEKLQWMQDLLVRTGNLAKPYDLAKLADPSLRSEAAAELK
jgi:NitT/TauT family transport system substrate-binding protein